MKLIRDIVANAAGTSATLSLISRPKSMTKMNPRTMRKQKLKMRDSSNKRNLVISVTPADWSQIGDIENLIFSVTA